MTFEDFAKKYTSRPIVLLEIDFDSGIRRYASIDVAGADFYSGKVLSFGSATRAMGRETGEYEISNVTTTLSNLDLEFSRLLATEPIRNRDVRYKVGFVGLALEGFRTVMPGIIDDYQISGDSFIITVRDASSAYFDQMPPAVVQKTDFPNCDQSSEGNAIPIIFGEVTSVGGLGGGAMPALYVDTTAFKYLIAGHPVLSVDAVYADGVPVSIPTISGDSLGTYLTFGTDQGTSKITWDGQGLPYACIHHTGTYPGTGDASSYCRFLDQTYEIASGDHLEYDIFIDPRNSNSKYTLDFRMDDGSWFSDTPIEDEDGFGLLLDSSSPAFGLWYHRIINLSSLAGKTISNWWSAHQGTAAGDYRIKVANARITNGATLKTTIYDSGPITVTQESGGYTDIICAAGDLITNAVDCFEQFLLMIPNFSSAKINYVSFCAACAICAARSYVFSNGLFEKLDVHDWISRLVGSFDAAFFVDHEGLFSLSISDPGNTANQVAVFSDMDDILKSSLVISPRFTDLTNRIGYRYGYRPSKGDWTHSDEAKSSASIASLLREYSSEVDLWFISDAAAAMDLITRKLNRLRDGSFDVVLKEPLYALIVDLADKIGVSHRFGPNAAGSGWKARDFYVDRILLDLDQKSVEIEATDLQASDIPIAFAFTDVVVGTLATVITSDPIIVTGVNVPIAISITGGEYQVGGGAWKSDGGMVENGQAVRVRITSASEFSTHVSCTLTIGGVSDDFDVTTEAMDNSPDAFDLGDITDSGRSVLNESNTVHVSGINTAIAISISGGGGQYRKNGGGWTSAAGTVVNGDSVEVILTSSPDWDEMVSTTLNIGGVTDAFTVMTHLDTTPDDFYFDYQDGVQFHSTIYSNVVLIEGINSPAAVTIVGGEYSIDVGGFTSDPGVINNSLSLRLALVSASNPDHETSCTVTVGGVESTFTVRTIAG
jgi:hypothetical protein